MALSLKQATTLIVDDFQSMRTMLRDFVRYMGVSKIDTANNGKDAISHLKSTRYDIVICDYNLGPGANGQQVLEEAKLRNHVGVSTIWVMVTAEKTQDMVMGAAEIKPDDYLLKPINQILLQSRLEKLILRKESLGVVEAAIRAKDFAVAIGHCDQLIQTEATHHQEIWRIKSDLLLTLGDSAAAQTLFETVLAARNVPWAKTGLGKVLFYTRDFIGAESLFRQVLADNPMYVEAADWLAKTLDAMGDVEQAQQVLMDAVKISPHSPVRQKRLGDMAFKNGDLDMAQIAFERTVKISEFSAHKNSAVYARLADVLSDKDDPQGALNVLKRSKEDFRFNPSAALQTAAAESRVYQKMGQTGMAQAAMVSVEKLADQLGSNLTPELMMEVAKSHFRMGQKDKACKLLGDIIKNNHENTEISSQIEAIFVGEQLTAEGQALIHTSRQEVIDINNQGVTLAKQGNFQEGVKLLRSAVTKLPTSEVMLINLCGLLIGQMNKEGYKEVVAVEAKDLLDKVHRLNPANQKYYSYSLVLNKLHRDS